MDNERVSLEELIFEFLHFKKYEKTLQAFITESTIGATPSLNKTFKRRKTEENRGDLDLEKLQNRIREKIFANFIPSEFVTKIVSPVSKIESALQELNRVLNSNDIVAPTSTPMQKTLYNRPSGYSKFSKSAKAGACAPAQERPSQILAMGPPLPSSGQTTTVPSAAMQNTLYNCASFSKFSKTANELANETPAASVTELVKKNQTMIESSPKRSLPDKISNHVRKTPNPKTRQSSTEVPVSVNNGQFVVAIYEPDKWNQMVDERINDSIVPDTMAEMINNCYVTQEQTNLVDIVQTMEGNQDLMRELESMLVDYCSTEESTSSSHGELFHGIDFDSDETVQPSFATLTNMAHQVEPIVDTVQFEQNIEQALVHPKPELPSSSNTADQNGNANHSSVKSLRTASVPSYVVKALFTADTTASIIPNEIDKIFAKPDSDTHAINFSRKKKQKIIVTPDKMEAVLKKLHHRK